MIRRREFITLLGGAAAAWPHLAQAQAAGRTYRVGFLIPGGRETLAVAATFDELRLNGFIEGHNLQIVSGGFNIGSDQIAGMAAIIANAEPDAIICGPELHIRALQHITRTVPLLGLTEDMVGEGLVASLGRPGGNTTGVSILSPELDGKRQDLLIEAFPGVRKIAAIADASTMKQRHIEELRAAARARGVEFGAFGVARPDGVAPVIEAAKIAGAEALNFLGGSIFPADRDTAFERVAALRLPAIYQWPEYAEAGGIMGYGPSFTQMFRQRARMLVKVLRGTKPADLPVEQPTRFELAINLKSAKAIAHDLPATLVLRADNVIE